MLLQEKYKELILPPANGGSYPLAMLAEAGKRVKCLFFDEFDPFAQHASSLQGKGIAKETFRRLVLQQLVVLARPKTDGNSDVTMKFEKTLIIITGHDFFRTAATHKGYEPGDEGHIRSRLKTFRFCPSRRDPNFRAGKPCLSFTDT